MRIKCFGGPLDGNKVDEALGNRWPYVLLYEYGKPEVLIGHYVLQNEEYDQKHHWYKWESKNEIVILPGLAQKLNRGA